MINIIKSYLLRHRNATNLVLHIIGIPLVIIGVVYMFFKKWRTGVTSIFIGYIIQYVGHVFFEHNQMGEITLITEFIKNIFG